MALFLVQSCHSAVRCFSADTEFPAGRRDPEGDLWNRKDYCVKIEADDIFCFTAPPN